MKLRLEPNDDLKEAVEGLRKAVSMVVLAIFALAATVMVVLANAH